MKKFLSALGAFLSRFYMIIIFIFLYAPIILLMVFSFNEGRSTSVFTGFSLRWYVELFHDSQIMDALYYTVLTAVVSSLVAAVVGTISAIGISRLKGWQRNSMVNVANLPIINPDILTGVSLMLLFILMKMPLGLGTMMIAHITFNIPYVILSVLPHMRQMDPHLYEAAMDLGASPSQAFFKVIIPELMPGIISGTLLAFTMSIDDFIISFFTTGNGISNLSIVVYSMAKRGIKPSINALSTIMFLTVLILLVVVNLIGKSGRKAKKPSRQPVRSLI
ncbi:MAG: ABC transporter permease [Firmicutes bacterium]|nr:ABC transporter permease [Bacillota bacterium]